MKQLYDQRIREMHEELQNRMRQLQRVERNNIELQHKNRQLSDLVASHQVQVISTISGSGSNQRDSQSLFGSRRGQPPPQNDNEEEDEQNRIFTGTEDEGTGGGSYFQNNQIRSQPNNEVHHYGYGEEGGNLAEHFEDEGLEGSEGVQRNRNAGYAGFQVDAVGGVH